YNRETLVGLLIGLPLLYWLGALPQRALDIRLGDLSYGVFLNHFLVQWALIGQPLGWPALVTYLALTLMLSVAIQYLIERPVLRWRRQLRQVSPNGR
ncbi:MAG: acyltransferase, partial [Herminiimonas sp.]|nr:acyltransferase [Herminiimonas sp.]